MRNTGRVVVTAALLGGGLLVAAPVASAQTPCPYPGDDCVQPSTPPGSGGGTPVTRNRATPTTLPFTGGELTLMGVVGAAALGGGVVLVAAGRKRASD